MTVLLFVLPFCGVVVSARLAVVTTTVCATCAVAVRPLVAVPAVGVAAAGVVKSRWDGRQNDQGGRKNKLAASRRTKAARMSQILSDDTINLLSA